METQKTILYNYHKSLGAKFVSFAGYEMPVQYSAGVVAEHKTTRSEAGLFDVSHMGQLSIEGGDDLILALEKIIPLDFKSIRNNQSKYTFLTNINGGIYDDLIITKVEKGFNFILNAACKKNDFQLIKDGLNNKFKLTLHKDLSLIALQGPKAPEILEKLIKGVSLLKFMNGQKFIYETTKVYITRSGYTGEDGFEISIPNDLVENFAKKLILNGAKPTGLGARDTLRLEAGLCLYGHDINETTTPIEANLKWAISKKRMKEGGFLGFDKIKLDVSGKLSRLRIGIRPCGKIIAREGTKIFSTKGEEIGLITSGTFGPSVNSSIAMGYVKFDFAKPEQKILLEVRGKKYEAVVSELPFYKKNYVR
ncbi:MAG: glycine cleavage system protein T [Candidatus Pelagibacter sp. TMED64]|nr:glycine cleavage system protein T [Candidatus Pelagibacter sp.]OUU67348.1 MAG: glycine cleavage system protein T [Candidatus Pelagibacter sp. TMED64]|tara:strand:+ start:4443 stop:5537 length:1095 start_codon:yes stop_codon:yes gene_type:complete